TRYSDICVQLNSLYGLADDSHTDTTCRIGISGVTVSPVKS
ncbi:hypothetical protein PROVRETT_10143, partial [Providencia rettgeri DSM 1131]